MLFFSPSFFCSLLPLFISHTYRSEWDELLFAFGSGAMWRCRVRPSLNVRAIGEGCKTHRAEWKRGTWMKFFSWMKMSQHKQRTHFESTTVRMGNVSSAERRQQCRMERQREVGKFWNAKTQRRVFISIYISHEAKNEWRSPETRQKATIYNVVFHDAVL